MFFFQATFLLGKGERTNDDLEEVECTSKAISVMVSAAWTDLKAYGQGRISLELHDNLPYKRCFLTGEL